MGKKGRRQSPAKKTTAKTAVVERAPTPQPAKSPATASDSIIGHHGNHRQLLADPGQVKGRPANSQTTFGNMRLHDSRERGSRLNLYIALDRLVAVNFGPELDFTCWNYHSYSLDSEGTAARLLQGEGPEDVSTCTRRNSLHARLPRSMDRGFVADIGAAATFISMQVDVGESSLRPVSFVHAMKVENDQHDIRARVFASADNGPAAVVATTHLREDTTSMLAFQSTNTDTVPTLLRQGSMTPGDGCPPLETFIDLSMYRAEPSSEAFIGRVLAQSLRFTTDY